MRQSSAMYTASPATAVAAAASDGDDDADADASWQLAWQNQPVCLVGITVIRDIINAVFGTGGNNPLGSLRSGLQDHTMHVSNTPYYTDKLANTAI